MRLLSSMTVLLACATVACQRGEASESYDGVVVTGAATSIAAAARRTPVPDTVPMASEADGRWALALLSGAASRPVGRARPKRAAAPIARATNLDLVLAPPEDHSQPPIELPQAKPAPAKICGVVNRRS